MKVAYISDVPWFLGFGGREVQMLKYAEYLSKNYGVEVIFPSYFEKNIDEGIKLFHFFGYSNWYSGLVPLLKNKRDIKILISPTLYRENIFILKLAKYYSRFCFIPNYFSYKKTIFQFCDRIIANSKSESVCLQQLFDIPKKKITVVYNAIDKNFDNLRQEDTDSFLKAFSVEPGYILSVSAITERKNTLNSIKSYLTLSTQINKKFIIIGDFQCTKAEYKKQIEKLINNNRDKILHIPYLSPFSPLLKSAYLNCAIHLLPSFVETPGLSNLETALFNKPIVAGDCRPVREYFQNYISYCNPNSIKDIYEKILYALNTPINPELSSFIRNNFTWNVVVDELYKTYQRILENNA